MSTGMSEVYTWLHAVPAHADQRAARRRARRRIPHDPSAAAQPADPADVRDGVALVRDAGRAVRAAPRAVVLHGHAAARVRQPGRVLAGLDQRAAARVALR